ncbi:MAG TPA: helix-hairpin-helix domain-containing protein [Anaeromyxobacter sp.]
MAARIALALVLVAALGAPGARLRLERPPAPRACAPEGRGTPPRHWLGCAADPGTPRALADDERIVLGLPLDPNRAGARALAFVPGLSRRLGEEIVADREANGPYGDVAELVRVRGIGPKRLAKAAPHLRLAPP